MLMLRALVGLLLLSFALTARADDAADARAALRKAVAFFHGQVADHGGYLWAYSADLKLREGENEANVGTVWVQPPGTPAVGMAMLEAWRRTGEESALRAAVDAGHALVKGQLHSGGWNAHIDFLPPLRQKQAYRVDGPPGKKSRNISSFDDDKSQSPIRLLARLDQVLEFKDEKIHEAALFALQAVLKAQHPNGGFSQVWDGQSHPQAPADLKASYPAEWSRQYPGGDYWWHTTFNDNNIANIVETLLIAHEVYRDPAYRQAALRAGDFILLAQMPGPQPAWAQQYNENMQPVWARKFEPPSVCTTESRELVHTLILLYRVSGDRKYLAPIPNALAWLDKVKLPDGRYPRFLELKTDKPLYFTRDYKLTYDNSDMPTHYGFITSFDLAKTRAEYNKAAAESAPKGWTDSQSPAQWDKTDKPTAAQAAEAKRIAAALDARGAWLEPGPMKNYKQVQTKISCSTFIQNTRVLSRFIQGSK